MIKLSAIQLVLLSNAAARADGSLLPPPDTVAGQMARIRKAIPPLLKQALVAEVDVAADDQIWQQAGDRKIGLAITSAGRQAIGAEDGTMSAAPSPEDASASASTVPVTKIGTVLTLLRRSDGATLAELVDATGWLPHTTRAALTGLRKKGHRIDKATRDRATTYLVEAA